MEPDRTGIAVEDPEVLTPIFLRMRSVMRLTGLGRSTIYQMILDPAVAPSLASPAAVSAAR